ncbi:hypothetical protein LENED_001130 [Lentinula edodes]|uniref:Uncharacterized protein n=1 Tax=Lentinula edodes TaxID=5353 RepID=A0A1Q3DXB6_LENED|nr:hypothetical protein LENED_001130 [Lentinula edodes]
MVQFKITKGLPLPKPTHLVTNEMIHPSVNSGGHIRRWNTYLLIRLNDHPRPLYVVVDFRTFLTKINSGSTEALAELCSISGLSSSRIFVKISGSSSLSDSEVPPKINL